VVEQRPFKPKVVGSIPTAPTIHLPDGWTLNQNTRGQKGANKLDDPVHALVFGGASDNRILQNMVDNRRKDMNDI
jgi:hypothetical protein